MTPIVLLGMHRSGTSALARVLNRMGAWLGSPEHVTRRWEHQPIQDCNEAILRAFGGHWSAPPPLPDGWTHRDEIAPLRGRAETVLADLTSHDVFAWKDPRSCLTLALWRELLPVEPVVVLSFRHPSEVAASLERRNSFGVAHALAMWERYNGAALRSAAGLRTLLVPYAELVEEPDATASTVIATLREWGVALPGSAADAVAEIDAERRHHVLPGDLADDVGTPSQRALWEHLAALPRRHEPFAAESAAVPRPHAASTELLAALAARWHDAQATHELEELLGSRRALLRRFVERNVEEVRERLRRA